MFEAKRVIYIATMNYALCSSHLNTVFDPKAVFVIFVSIRNRISISRAQCLCK